MPFLWAHTIRSIVSNMSGFPFPIDPLSFLIGLLIASAIWWAVTRARPLWKEVRENWTERRESAQLRRTSSVEENHRRITLRRAQGMHLAAPLFALDEILVEPLLMAPPQTVEPGGTPAMEDVVSQTLPYLPAWPELAAAYRPAAMTLDQALSGGSNVVLIGQPGIGKTVALAHLASLAANRTESLGALKDALPFLVHIADLKLPVAGPKAVLEPLIEAASEHAPVLDLTRLPVFIQNAFKSGRALLLADGFDELPPENQQIVTEYFRVILQLYPGVHIVTTGAPEHLDGLIALGFAPLPVLSWSERRSAQFIRRWGELWAQYVPLEAWAQSGPEQVDPMLLDAWLSVQNDTDSPLELTLKVWGAFAGDSLGPHVLEAMATHIRRIAPADTPLAALETLAMQVVLSAQPIFDPRRAREWVQTFEPVEEGSAVDSAATRPILETQSQDNRKKRQGVQTVSTPTTGLLGRMVASGLLLSHPYSRLRFAHPVFQGFLAGRALSNYNASDALLNQPDWSGKYLAMRYLAAHGDAGPLVERLLEWSRMPMHRPLLTAARWLRDAPRDAPWRGKLFAALAGLLQTEGIPLSLRGQALAAFVVSNDASVAALFRQFGTTLSFELVELAALGSGVLRDTRAVPVLERVLSAPSLSARRAACMALVAIGTDEALEIVARTLLNADEDLRRAAAESLANDPGEGHAMLKDGMTLADIILRRAVVYGLARVDESWAGEELQRLQVQDDQWVVRNAAAEALERRTKKGSLAPRKLRAPSEAPWLIEFAGKEGLGISPGAPATDVLIRALNSEDPDTRLAALPYLKYMPTDGVITQLYSAMYRDDPELREAAYYTLWEIGTAGVKLPHPSQYGFS